MSNGASMHHLRIALFRYNWDNIDTVIKINVIGPMRDWSWLRQPRQPIVINTDRLGKSLSLEVMVTQGQGTSQGVSYP